MDKEQLLRYFGTHYLSRREVLFRLPLNVPIGSFWPELLNRRKANATVLPLCDGSGKPYWYVLTDKMIAASERLCAEAMKQEAPFDPYKPLQNSEMTDEIFFTSYVEGAQITRAEAMSYIKREKEPVNIGEQMIANNSKAMNAVMRSLFRPIDEQYMKGLAYMLTEDMIDCAEGYRTEDYHSITAMNNEPYEVPSAAVLPDRMNGLYEFLASPDTHPLIKAAVSQAYILVTRPFSEGNERLSRMISLAILLRSGYDFFRDISISAAIAKENYSYYKSMCDIIRSENGGDLTYFVEYYLNILVQAIDMKAERDRKKEQERFQKEQETIRREQEMARQPLGQMVKSGEQTNTLLPAAAETVKTEGSETGEMTAQPEPDDSPPGLEDVIRSLECSRCSTARDAAVRLRNAVDTGRMTFSRKEWSEWYGITMVRTEADICLMREKRIVSYIKKNKYLIYTILPQVKKPEPVHNIPVKPSDDNCEDGIGIETALEQIMSESINSTEKNAANIIRRLLDQGVTAFRNKDWRNMSPNSDNFADQSLLYTLDRGMIGIVSEKGGYRIYRICNVVPTGICIRSLSDRQRELMRTLYQLYENRAFTLLECRNALGVSYSSISESLKHLEKRQLIDCIRGYKSQNRYQLQVTPDTCPECFQPSRLNLQHKAVKPGSTLSAGVAS